jgi:1-acyl-sn-glycerol-3-phosphate acyltransferase
MMRRFVELNGQAFDNDLDVLVFPEGTRSRRLARGHIGLAQIALHHRRAIVPVGCSGSDRAYPGGSPIARAAHVVYRIGRPITWEEMAPYHVRERFEPFTPEAERTHRTRFQGLVDMVMDRINALVDEPYRRVESADGEATRSAARFI